MLQGRDFSDIGFGVTLLRQAVEHEHPEALFLMATLHNKGHLEPFVEKNEAIALALIGKSARLGYAPAQKLIFKEDLDVGLGPLDAAKWIASLAIRGDKEAEGMYIAALVSQGKHAQVQQFKKMILDSQKATSNSHPAPSTPAAVTKVSRVSDLSAPSKVFAPHFSSSKLSANNKNNSVTQSVDGLASNVAALTISEPREPASSSAPQRSVNANNKKKKKRK